MIRKLLIVFASGLALSIFALSAAWIIGGRDLMTRIGHDRNFTLDWDEDSDEPSQTRRLTFDGSLPLAVDFPVSLRFTRDDKAEMTVSGPANAIKTLRWENGALSLGDKDLHHGAIRVNIRAPQIAGLVLSAPGEVKLRDLDQPALRLDVHGPAEIEASGKVQTLDIRATGIGSIDLAHVEARDARASISGVGAIELNASGRVDADISGAGSVTLHRKPAILNSRTSGIGSVDHDY